MNKCLIICLAIFAEVSYANSWIETKICNTTNDDITLYKSTYKEGQSGYAWKNWHMYDGKYDQNNTTEITEITIPSTANCFDGPTKTITLQNNAWSGINYITLCSIHNYCISGRYSLQFYNPYGHYNKAGVVPGYTYYFDMDNEDKIKVCGYNSVLDPKYQCAPFSNYEKTACFEVDKNERVGGGIDYVYRCTVTITAP